MARWEPGSGVWCPGVVRAPGLGLRRGKLKQRTLDRIERVIVHHTGVGILSRFLRQRERFGWSDPLEAAVHVYARIMNASGHYVVGYDGAVVQCVGEDRAAWHAGYGKARRRARMVEIFARMRFDRRRPDGRPRWLSWHAGRYDWWAEKWYESFGIASPVGWFPDLDVNGRSIGIELVSHKGAGPFPDEQLRGGPGGPGLAGLLRRCHEQYGVPLHHMYVLTHSDAVPTARTTKKGWPYDPPPYKLDLPEFLATL